MKTTLITLAGKRKTTIVLRPAESGTRIVRKGREGTLKKMKRTIKTMMEKGKIMEMTDHIQTIVMIIIVTTRMIAS